MTWSYSGDPSSSAMDEVRFLIGDTDASSQMMSNEEIAYLVTVSPDGGTRYSNYPAAISACRSLAAKYAKQIDKTVGSLSISYSQKHTQYLSLAAELQKANTTNIVPGVPLLGGGGEKYLSSNNKSEMFP